jgi:3-hydroxyisobutyrate dehydrogenase
VINAGNARSYSTEVKFPRFILDRSFDDGFALDLMAKDLKIALETAAEIGHPMFSGSTIAQLWQAAAAQEGYGSAGHTSIHAFLERLTGEEQ